MNSWLSQVLKTPLRESERGLLKLIRESGPLSKAELARISGMSAQGVAVIMDGLIEQGVVLKGTKQRGRVGQPSTPLTINPEGAFAIGLHLKPGEMRAALIDLSGEALEIKHRRLETDQQLDFDSASELVADMLTALGEDLRKRAVGIAIACPGRMMAQCGEPGPRRQSLRRERAQTLQTELETRFELPVLCEHEVRAACIAELRDEESKAETRNRMYLRIGRELHGTLVLDGRMIGESGAPSSSIGTLPFTDSRNFKTIDDAASFRGLETLLKEENMSLAEASADDFQSAKSQAVYAQWTMNATDALAHTVLSSGAVLPIDSFMIDCGLKPARVEKLVGAVRDKLGEKKDTIEVIAGKHGAAAAATGAALLPLEHVFSPDPERVTPAPKAARRAA